MVNDWNEFMTSEENMKYMVRYTSIHKPLLIFDRDVEKITLWKFLQYQLVDRMKKLTKFQKLKLSIRKKRKTYDTWSTTLGITDRKFFIHTKFKEGFRAESLSYTGSPKGTLFKCHLTPKSKKYLIYAFLSLLIAAIVGGVGYAFMGPYGLIGSGFIFIFTLMFIYKYFKQEQSFTFNIGFVGGLYIDETNDMRLATQLMIFFRHLFTNTDEIKTPVIWDMTQPQVPGYSQQDVTMNTPNYEQNEEQLLEATFDQIPKYIKKRLSHEQLLELARKHNEQQANNVNLNPKTEVKKSASQPEFCGVCGSALNGSNECPSCGFLTTDYDWTEGMPEHVSGQEDDWNEYKSDDEIVPLIEAPNLNRTDINFGEEQDIFEPPQFDFPEPSFDLPPKQKPSKKPKKMKKNLF